MFTVPVKTLSRGKTQAALGWLGLALNAGWAASAFAGVCPGMPAVAVYTLDTDSNLYVVPAGAQNFINPVVDAIRLIGSNTQNYAIVSANGGTLNQLVRQTNMSFGNSILTATPNITAGAYDNNFAGATTTTFYVLDHSTDTLGLVPVGPNGSSNTAAGVVGYFPAPIVDPNAPVFGGASINITPTAGLDIYTVTNGANIAVATSGKTLYCLGVQRANQPGGPVIYDLNATKRGGFRIVATQAAVKDLDEVDTFIDVAVGLF